MKPKLIRFNERDMENIALIKKETGMTNETEIIRVALYNMATKKNTPEASPIIVEKEEVEPKYVETEEDEALAYKSMEQELKEERERLKLVASQNMANLQGTPGAKMLEEIVEDHPATVEPLRSEFNPSEQNWDGVDDQPDISIFN